MSLFKNKQERIRFLKFAFVGVTGTIVDFGLLNLFSLVVGLPLVWAQALSFSIAVVNNFLWNRFWTYPESRSRGASKQLLQFVLINVIGIAIRTVLIPWFDRILLQMLKASNFTLPLDNFILSQNLALAITIGIVMLWNYFANRYWTYSNVPIGISNPVSEITMDSQPPLTIDSAKLDSTNSSKKSEAR